MIGSRLAGSKLVSFTLGFAAALMSGWQPVLAANLNLADKPLFVSTTATPLNMLVMGRDHKLYYEAYNDASDLNDDGVLDIGYQGYQGKEGTPELNIDYYGYFNSYACYDYSEKAGRFVPTYVKSAEQVAARDKTCHTVAGGWSGDFLNYITTARIDAIRKVLYGGYRSTDTKSLTVLERSHIPQDAHSWGKEYKDVDTDGYDISHYTPMGKPVRGGRHLFANVSLSENAPPLMRVLNDSPHRIWEWVSKERPVAGNTCVNDVATSNSSVSCEKSVWDSPLGRSSTITDYEVRVESCRDGVATAPGTAISDSNCQTYGERFKPIGILHEFGENDSMLFGLLTGSYRNNLDGGVLRKRVSSFKDEVNPKDGTFTDVVGIVKTIDRLRTVGFNYGDNIYWDNCGWVMGGPINNGKCAMWGNPIGEMMYETLRYFAGKKKPTNDFAIHGLGQGNGQGNGRGQGRGNYDTFLGLPLAKWDNPYETAGSCAKPFQVVISDINPSYDSDKVPGSYFNPAFKGDISGLNVTNLADTITRNEPDVTGMKYIGQSEDVNDSTPSPKKVTSLGKIRGLSPEEPTKLGSYYAASLAYYGLLNDLNPAKGSQKVQTFAVALASPLPKIEIPVGSGKTVNIVPFAKSVGGGGVNPEKGKFQPTNQIVDFYVESLSDTSGSFLINYEDVEQGADHDMDAVVRYTYQLNTNGTVTIDVESVYAEGGNDQHMGYVISGTTADGIYLEVKDQKGADVNYFLDTPPSRANADAPRGTDLLDLSSSRTFTPGNTTGAGVLKDPLWYAAKWGGFDDVNNNGIPDDGEWDKDDDGDPDNYFLVTNALNLSKQLRSAFNDILNKSGSSSAVAVNSGSLNADTLLFQAVFNAEDWSGEIKAIPLQADGSLGAPDWRVSTELDDQASLAGGHSSNRDIITINTSTGKGVPFRWPDDYTNPNEDSELSQSQITSLLSGTADGQQDYGQDLLDYLRGDKSEEAGAPGTHRAFRKRKTVLGDIVNSDPQYIQAPGFFFPNAWPSGSPENSELAKTYSEFRAQLKERKPMLAFGANDGMLHIVNAYSRSRGADAGREILAYVPGEVYGNLNHLSDPGYTHRYYVDGKLTYSDAFLRSASRWHTVLAGGLGAGGQGIFALDITDPTGTIIPYKAFDESNADDLVLWEFTDEDHPDLGYTFGQPAIARMANGRWAAIFANGYNNTEADGRSSETGNAVLYIVDIEDGSIMTVNASGETAPLDTLQGTADDPLGEARPNGLATPVLTDTNGDSIVDYIYAGDLFGNLWKIDVTSSNAADWDFAFTSGGEPAPLFVARDASGNRLPITTQPQVSRHPVYRTGKNYMMFFGTGKYFETGDNTASGQNTQAFFGIWDNGTNGAVRSELLRQSITNEVSVDGVGFRIVSDNKIRWDDEVSTSGEVITGHRGWVLDLINTEGGNTDNHGERQVSNSTLRNDRLIFTTLIPSSDPCEFGGSGWLMEISPATGGRLDVTPLDLNGDGLFNGEDMVDTDGDEVADSYVSGQGTASGDAGGIITQPAILDNGKEEKKYSSLSSGSVGIINENPTNKTEMRQSWREVY